MMEINGSIYVFSTKGIVENRVCINYIVHDYDGDWQFLNLEEDLTEDNARLLSLEEVIDMDDSIANVLKMDIGYYAIKSENTNSWIIKKLSEDQ
ncbi:MAG: hypothetical protein J5875_07845 [Paludibacteraceae bacterium]|nr:hypothetical protein [Paludibacteraceae bacterium]